MFDIDKIRADFPILNNPDKPVIYFDNACMSLRPAVVIDAISNYYTTMSACAGRSNHRLADLVSKSIENARQSVGQFINAKRKEEIVFTRNTSEGLNLLANSLNLKANDVVVISDKEHNSNLVPWLRLKQTKGIDIRVVKSSENNEPNIEEWKLAIDDRVKIVSFVFTSNLDGVSNPVKEITKLAHQVGATVIVDAAQAVPHQKINVRDLDIDFMVFSLHKMCGPSGMGVLYGKYSLLDQLDPFMVGGDTVERTTYTDYTMLPVPEKFEAGLQDYAGIIGAGAAVGYLTEIGLQNIHQYECELNEYLSERMSDMARINLIGPADACERGGIYNFYVNNVNYHQIALMLDQTGNIAVRSGQHCVHSWFNDRGIQGSVRASLYFYNTKEEVDSFIKTLKKILTII